MADPTSLLTREQIAELRAALETADRAATVSDLERVGDPQQVGDLIRAAQRLLYEHAPALLAAAEAGMEREKRASQLPLLAAIYHAAWHLMDESSDGPGPEITVERDRHKELGAALEAFEISFPQMAHGEEGWSEAILAAAESLEAEARHE